MTGEVLSPVELKEKVDALRELIAERIAALEEEKKLGHSTTSARSSHKHWTNSWCKARR